MADEVKIELEEGENMLEEVGKLAPNLPMSAAHGIAAMAMNFALKYHDIATVQDGALYQQYKLEGRNFRDLHMDMVFHTAMQIEAHIIGAPSRLTAMFEKDLVGAVHDVLKSAFDDETPEGEPEDQLEPTDG